MTDKDNLTLHVVSSTHWDREWYYTFQEFRVQLVDLMDSLLKLMDADPGFWRFMMDGQTAPIEDYLEIRPEKAAEIERFVRGGQLQIGPWYVLADEWLCSPETYIRNAQVGREIARRFGGEMKAPYLPDVFGHVSQMPQILRGLGFDVVCISRGTLLSKTNMQFWWSGADGTKILCHAGSYGNAAKAFRGETPAESIDALLEDIVPRTTSKHILLMNSGDHHEPVPNLRQRLEEYGRSRPHKVIHSTLPAFLEEVKKSDLSGLPEVSGELREGLKASAAYLYDCISSRMPAKQAAQRVSDLLEKWAEPFIGVASTLGFPHPTELLWQAWKYLLQNCAHDSICGCSVDRVHEQMMTRFESAEEIAEMLTGRALDHISSKTSAGAIPDDATRFVVFNPSTRARSGQVLVNLEDREPTAPAANAPRIWPEGAPVCLVDPQGRRIATQAVPKRVDDELGITLVTMWSHARVNPKAFIFWANDVPALGYRVYGALPQEERNSSPLHWGANWAENEHVRLQVASDGSISLEDKASGAKFTGLGRFEDGGDRGGAYEFKSPESDTVITSDDARAKVELVDFGPAIVRFRVELVLRIPERLTTRRNERVRKTVPLRIVSYVSLGAASKSVQFHTIVWNDAVDHRLRAVFPTGLKAEMAHVDGHFDVMERPVASDRKPWPTEPQRRWVDVSDQQIGLAVMNRGLPEYEVTDGETRNIKLTLFRSNTHVTKEWWGLLKSPQAEIRGKSEYDYAVYAHSGDWKKGRVAAEAESVTLPLRAHVRYGGGSFPTSNELPPEASFVTVDSPTALTSILKKADDRDSLILRLYNPDKSETTAEVKLWKPVREAHLLDLWEERGEKLEPEKGMLQLRIPGKKIVTVELVVE